MSDWGASGGHGGPVDRGSVTEDCVTRRGQVIEDWWGWGRVTKGAGDSSAAKPEE